MINDNNTEELVNTEDQAQRTYKVYIRVAPDFRVYVGCTYRSLEERAGSTGSEYKSHTEFYKAIQEFGWENFLSLVLFETTDLEKARLAEKYYIKFFNSTNPEYGFNHSTAGYISDPTYLARLTEANRANNANPEIVAKIKASCKEFWDDPQKRKEHGKKIKKVLADPKIRAKMSQNIKAAFANEAPDAHAMRTKRSWEDPVARENRLRGIKLACTSPEYRKKCSEIQKIVQNSPEQKARLSQQFTGRKFINNGEQNKYVHEEECEQLLATGEWVLGRLPNKRKIVSEKFKNRKWVHKANGVRTLIQASEVDDYLAQGWILGRGELK